MKRQKSHGAKIVARLKSFAESLAKHDPIAERFTVRAVKADMQPHAYDAALVKKTRKMLGASQAVFANFCGVSVKTVHDWEQGRNAPAGAACRLMDEIRRDPQYWLARLRELTTSAAIPSAKKTRARGT